MNQGVMFLLFYNFENLFFLMYLKGKRVYGNRHNIVMKETIFVSGEDQREDGTSEILKIDLGI